MSLPTDEDTEAEEPSSQLDLSIIGKVAASEQPVSGSNNNVKEGSLYELEKSTLERSKDEFYIAAYKLEIQRLTIELKNSSQNLKLRRRFSRQILRYLWAFSTFCAVCLVLQGFSIYKFNLHDSILVTLVGGTAASAFGLVSVVLAGLFKTPIKGKEGEKGEDKTSETKA